MSSETVFRIDSSGSFSGEIEPIRMEAASYTERGHLQEWVLQHPEIVGSDVLIITSEYDQWQDGAGEQVADRLDVLGLDRDGRLVVVEIKRGRAPRFTELQAIGYAAMVSRFTAETLIGAHQAFLQKRGEPAGRDEVEQLLEDHVPGGMLAETSFSSPRIVILAEDFSPSLLSSIVWLSQSGVDIQLRQVQLYRQDPSTDGLFATVSQVWPLPEVEDFSVGPRGRDGGSARRATTLPAVPWTSEDLAALRDRLRGTKQEAAVLQLLDMASDAPELTVSWDELLEASTRNQYQLRSDLAHLTMMVKADFARQNWPFGDRWQGDQRSYFLDAATAATWRQLRDADAG
jgi:hypothetical protein